MKKKKDNFKRILKLFKFLIILLSIEIVQKYSLCINFVKKLV